MVYEPSASSTYDAHSKENIVRVQEQWRPDMDNVPKGFWFAPTEEELIKDYLINKVLGRPLPCGVIKDIDDIYRYKPDDLPLPRHSVCNAIVSTSYFFAFMLLEHVMELGPVHPTACGYGYWKATGEILTLKFEGEASTFRKALVFYYGKHPEGWRTNWRMHTYRLNTELHQLKELNVNGKNNYVICKVYNDGFDPCYADEEVEASSDSEDDFNNVITRVLFQSFDLSL